MNNKLSVKDRAMIATQFTPEDETVQLPDEQIPPIRLKTGPGALVAYMAKESEVFKENQSLKDELHSWSEASPVKKLDCALVRQSKWANRHDDSFLNSEYAELKADIESAGGNVQAIKVRPIPGSVPQSYEIVFGHRRHRACSELGLPVLAVIESIDDQALFVEMDRENRQRADLRPYEQGVMYAKALAEGLYPSMRKMAEKIGVDVGRISRYVALTELPPLVLSAFTSPMDLQYNWVSKLTQAIQENPEVILERAKVLCGTTPRLAPLQVFKNLTSEPGVVPHNTPIERHILKDKMLLATMTDGKNGRTTVSIATALNMAQKDELENLLANFLTKKCS